jgi:hypothetical protein
MVWEDGRSEHTITIETDVKPLMVVVGSSEVPDVDRSNNTWKN